VSEVREKPGIHPFRDAIVKLVAVALILFGLSTMMDAFSGGHGFWGATGLVLLSLLRLGIGVGLLRYQGWAFLLFSLLLIVRWFVTFTGMVVSFDGGGFGAGESKLVWVLVITVLIAIFSRWSMERHFRPDSGVGH